MTPSRRWAARGAETHPALRRALRVLALLLMTAVLLPSTARPAFAAQQPGMTWTQAGSTGPAARYGAAIAYDQATSKVVLFGGAVGSSTFGDTWTWSGSAWTKVTDTGPPKRVNAVMAYDQARAKLVLFGGYDPDNGRLGDTWTWNGSAWSQVVQTSGTPPSARASAAMEFDPATGQLILFGGVDASSTFLNDTWSWDGTNWSRVSTTGPAARVQASLTFIPAGGQLLLFGGTAGSGNLYGDTWSWSASGWTQVATTGVAARYGQGAAYDPLLGSAILFGGTNGSGTATGTNIDTTTYAWSGSSWSALSVSGTPTARSFTRMVFDPRAGQVLLFGGISPGAGGAELADTWVLTIDPSTGFGWNRAATTGPPARAGMATGFDPATGQLLLFGGFNGTNGSTPLSDTWSWTGASWTNVTPAAPTDSPSARRYAAIGFDAATGQMLLFGGKDGTGANAETWVWNWSGTSGVWQKLTPATSPSARWGASMAFDAATGQMLLYGGTSTAGAAGAVGDTWAWTGTTWSQLASSGTPGTRAFATLDFDQNSGQMVMDGGLRGTNRLNDTYAWNGSSDWTLITSTGGPTIPSARDFDPRQGRTIGFGLKAGNTFSWDGSAWSSILSTGPPVWDGDGTTPQFGDTTITFDASTGQMVHFGGWTSPSSYNANTWVLAYQPELIGPATASGSATSSGYDQTVALPQTIQINDPAVDGWNLTVTADKNPTKSAPAATLPALVLNGGAATTAKATTAPTVSCVSGSCTAPSGGATITYPVTVPTSSSTRIFSSASGTGIGRTGLAVKLWATIPGNALAGTYTSQVTVSTNYGP